MAASDSQYSALSHRGIQTLSPYIPGKSIEAVAQEHGVSDIIKLASNENPLGCSPLAIKALSALTTQNLATYPAPTQHPLYAKLANHLNIPTDMLILSNGTDPLFSLLLTSFALHTDREMLTHRYAFNTYQIQAQTLGIPVKHAPLTADWQVDIDAMLNHCNDKTALIFIANPNNPTGGLIEQNEIKQLLNNIPNTTILVLDEAYVEYAHHPHEMSSLHLLKQYDNLVITRTFSKIYGLAGLRIGYGIANPEIIRILQRVQLPFSVNYAALSAASAAMDDTDFINQSITLNQQGLIQLQQGLSQLNLSYLATRGNFITINCMQDTHTIDQQLQKEGVIVRPLHPYGLNQYLRVTIGTREQNSRFLSALQKVIKALNSESIWNVY